MKKLTKEEIIKKDITNVRSAVTALLMPFVLGLIFAVRYMFTGNYEFYFGFSFVEALLRLYDKGSLPGILVLIVVGAFFVCWLMFTLKSFKNQKWFLPCLIMYLADCLSYALLMLTLIPRPIAQDEYIDLFFHGFIVLFLILGVRSHKKLEAQGIKVE